MLFPVPALTAADQAVLADIEDRRQVLAVAAKRTPWLRRHLTADAISGSNWIEGFRVAPADVEDLMDGEPDVEVSDEDHAETLAYYRTLTYVQTLWDAADFSYDKGLLNGLHWLLQGHRHSPSEPAGQWRPGGDAVPGLMGELVDGLNEDDGGHPLVRAAMAHLNLVTIRPWSEGNGRMARTLQSLMIAREGVLPPQFLSIEAWLGGLMNARRYHEAIQRGPDQDVSSWVRLNLTAYHHRAQLVQRKIDKSVEAWGQLRTFAAQAGLDERVVFALHDVAMTGRVRRARFARAERVSLKLAQRELRDLTAAGLLEPVGGARVRYHVEGPRFPERILEAARRPMTLTEPYAKALG